MYKTIVVHVDDTADASERIAVAARLAQSHEAHLVGAAMTGLTPYLLPVGGFAVAPALVAFPIEQLRARADAALDMFDATMRDLGIASWERRRVDDEAGIGLAIASRCCDLLVIGRRFNNEARTRLPAAHPESVVLNSAAPVLLIPPGAGAACIARRIAIGWNGSANAARAIRSALPLMRQATEVEVLVFNPEDEADLHGASPGIDLASHLARHGVRVTLTVRPDVDDTGAALIAHATHGKADLIVMGAFGHARFRELVFGGATQTALTASAIPLWMAH